MKEEKKKRSIDLFEGKKKIIISVIIILAIIIGSVATYIVSIQKKVKKWDNLIYPNVYVENVNLSGMTEDKAIEVLEKDIEKPVENKVIKAQAGDKSIDIKYSDLSPEYNIEETVKEAISYGKGLNLFEKNSLIDGKGKKELNLDFKYDESKLKDYEKKLMEMVNKKAKNAKISISGGNINITEGEDGQVVEEDKMVSLVKEAINVDPESNQVVNIPIEVTKPKITKTMLSKIDGVIGSFTTSYTSSDANRSANVEIATKEINGTVLMPGDTFSYNNTLGERTTDKGYRDGAAYVGNKVVMVTGGGICQVSTTLYRAVLRTGIMPTERHNHSMTTTYSGPSEDATVSWGSLDYQFKNTYDFPIYIQGYTSDKHVTFNIYGNIKGMDGKTYELKTIVNETLKPSVKTVEDSSLPEGQKVVEQRPVIGYKSVGYLVTYQNGKEIDKKLIGYDVYKQKDEIIRVGTKGDKQTKQEDSKKEHASLTQPEASKQDSSNKQNKKPSTEGQKVQESRQSVGKNEEKTKQ